MTDKIKSIIFILIGSFIFAFGINWFAIPNGLAEGGVAGITIITYYLFEWPPGLTNLIINGFLILIGYKFLDKLTLIYTILCIIFTSVFLHLTEEHGVSLEDTLLASIFAGFFIGLGLGLIFRGGGTSGGSAVIARLANQYLGWNISKTMLFIDLLVVGSAFFIIGGEKTMYTIISLYIGAKVVDYIIEGLNPRKAITIISKNSTEVAEQVNEKMNRGVTVFSAHGSYTKESKDVLYVIINKQELIRLKQIIHKIDQQAFVVVHDVRDVFGVGFTIPKPN
ncbi:YitT family protein [Priestia aryabhattai]|uniref:YitT family protein n=1 Tax=Priestia aryabhattai TaxID=412384 RepID=UPI001C0D7E6E|nr:YitT family protein [Priestia aryabhattai]MBU3568640.1 YitT family protein [Priestia aryabhattai]